MAISDCRISQEKGKTALTLVFDNEEEMYAFYGKLSLRGDIPSSTVKVGTATETKVATPVTVHGGKPSEQRVEIDAKDVVDSQIMEALGWMRGNDSARMLLALMESPGEWVSDVDIRETLGLDEDQNFGPIVSNISKCCKKAGIPNEAIYRRRTKRGRKGKVFYWYALTSQAIELIRQIPDFDKQDDGPPLDYELDFEL